MLNKIKNKLSITTYDKFKKLSDSSKLTMPFEQNKIEIVQKPSIFSEGSSFKGDLHFSGQIFLDGFFDGTLNVEKVTIGRNGKFVGLMEAKSVVLFGELIGEVTCEKLTLNAGSVFDGSLSYETIKIEKGSNITGKLYSRISN